MTDDLNSQPSEQHNDQAMLDLEAVMNLPQGKRFVVSILNRCAIYSTAYAGDSPAAVNLRLGEQNIGLWLVAQLGQVGPTVYPQLLLEQARQVTKTENVRVLDQE